MAPQITFKYGETVNYQGNEAKVVSHNTSGDYLRIETEDGKIIVVNKNDLFGINSSPDSPETGIASRVSYYDEQIEKNKNFINLCQQRWNDAKEGIKTIKEKMRLFLALLDITHANQIQNAAQKKEYKSMSAECSDLRGIQIRSSADILHTANETGSLVLDKGNWLNQSIFGLA